MDIVFDGPPGPVSGRFIEVEDGDGHGVDAGTWIERPDGMWVLRIDRDAVLVEFATTVEENFTNICLDDLMRVKFNLRASCRGKHQT